MKKNHVALFPRWLAPGILLLCLSAWPRAQAGTIAYWQFESGNLAADSAGTNTLNVTNITSSGDKMAGAPGTGSAVFNGNAFAQTVGNLFLSPYTNLTFEWLQKDTSAGFGITMEMSPNYNFSGGTLLVDVNEGAAGQMNVNEDTWGGGYYFNTFEFPTDGTWNHYAVTVDTTDGTTNRFKIYLNGVRVNLLVNSVASIAPQFDDNQLNIGGRNFGAWGYSGQLDEIKISDQILSLAQFEIHFTGDSIKINQQPTNTTVVFNRPAAFRVAAVASNAPPSAIGYQWQRSNDAGANWANIPGATRTNYTIAAVTTNDTGAQFRVLLAIPLGTSSATSQVATLTVNSDNVPPAVASAASVEGMNVGITFTEEVDSNSALAGTNYTITGTTITNIILIDGGKSVLLEGATPLVGNSFTGVVSAVSDLAGNVMPAATPVSGPIEGLTLTDIGSAVASFSSVTNQYVFSDQPGTVRMYNGYGQTAGTADGCWYLWSRRTNDFDITVQVTRADIVGVYSRGGLTLREDLAPGGRQVTMGAYSLYMAFMQPYARFTADMGATAPTPGGIVGYYPYYGQTSPLFTFPNVWIRMQRTGNILSEYWGTNGVTWNLQGTIDLSATMVGAPFPSEVYVGVFSDPEDTAATTGMHVDYRNFGNTIVLPTLTITRGSGTVTLSWPAASEGFSLVSRSTLEAGAWQPVSAKPTLAAGAYSVTLPTGSAAYYRLVRSL